MPRKKPRRKGPEGVADSVPPPAPAPAPLPPGEPTDKKPFQYQFEKDQAIQPPLTAQEDEIVGYVATGKQNFDIALQLGTGERNIEKHMKNIRVKLRAETRTEVVAWYYEEKIKKLVPKIERLEMYVAALEAQIHKLSS